MKLRSAMILVLAWTSAIASASQGGANVVCQSLDAGTLRPDRQSLLTFTLAQDGTLLNVTHGVQGGAAGIDGVRNQTYGQPEAGEENEPLILPPNMNSQITASGSYVGRFCKNRLFDRYYNRWIFLDRDFLSGAKSSSYAVLFVSLDGGPDWGNWGYHRGSLMTYVFGCRR